MSKIKRIGVIGEAMLELSHQTPTSLCLSFAGDTLNFAIYLRRLLQNQAFDIHYVTALGQDAYSDQMLLNWQTEGIKTDLVHRLENKLPGLYLIRTDDNGERTFYFYRSDSAARELFKGDN
ncbi:MAG: 2-dehydro-3-deoxygluconokinase, partial [Pseudomonadota bacterium]